MYKSRFRVYASLRIGNGAFTFLTIIIIIIYCDFDYELNTGTSK